LCNSFRRYCTISRGLIFLLFFFPRDNGRIRTTIIVYFVRAANDVSRFRNVSNVTYFVIHVKRVSGITDFVTIKSPETADYRELLRTGKTNFYSFIRASPNFENIFITRNERWSPRTVVRTFCFVAIRCQRLYTVTVPLRATVFDEQFVFHLHTVAFLSISFSFRF